MTNPKKEFIILATVFLNKSLQKISLEGVDKFGKMPEGVKKFSGGNF